MLSGLRAATVGVGAQAEAEQEGVGLKPGQEKLMGDVEGGRRDVAAKVTQERTATGLEKSIRGVVIQEVSDMGGSVLEGGLLGCIGFRKGEEMLPAPTRLVAGGWRLLAMYRFTPPGHRGRRLAHIRLQNETPPVKHVLGHPIAILHTVAQLPYCVHVVQRRRPSAQPHPRFQIFVRPPSAASVELYHSQ